MTALEFQNVTTGYRGQPVIRELSLAVPEGGMVGVLGPNGAGKTTLLRCATGLCPVLAGTVRLFGDALGGLSAAERARRVAVVPQELETPMAFSVAEMVEIGRTSQVSRWRAPGRQDRHIIERAMAYTDVVELRHRPFPELSGGEKQRVMVAMALAQEPRMIFLDEATSHLDLNHRLEIMQIVERLNREQGLTVVMISHDLNLAAEFCQQLVLLDGGRIAAQGTPVEVLTEENLRRVYHCRVRVQRQVEDGVVSVHPAPRLLEGPTGRGIRVHVVAGGGSGAELLRRLALCDYAVTCGVLNEGDSDAAVAAALEQETALAPPFSPIDAGALARAQALAAAAAAVIVGPVPWGEGNLANIGLAEQALAAGRRVLVATGAAERDYTAGRQATARLQALAARGAVLFTNITECFAALPVATES